MFVNCWNRVTTTTSLRQGRLREEGSEGSQRQICEPTDRNVIEGRVSGASWHDTTKPFDSGDTVNDTVVQRQFMLLFGEVCPAASWSIMGVGLRAASKGAENPPNPKVFIGHYGSRTEVHLERDGESTESYGDPVCPTDGNVSRAGQKSAKAIVADYSVKGRTVSNKEEP